MAQAAAQSVPRSFTDQECPLCAQTDWKSPREYFTHLGKHLEQISLAALPQEEDESEDDSDQDDKENLTFKCICGFDDGGGSTVLDERCNTWQHIACYYGKSTQIPEEHLCVECLPRNLDTADASRRQRKIRSKAPVNHEMPEFQDVTSAPYIQGQENPSLHHLLDNAPNDRPLSAKRYICPYCDTDFTRHRHLISHLQTHSSEKPFVCPYCQSSFSGLHDLKRHTKVHMTETRHVCSQCGRNFTRGDALARHQKGPGGCQGRRSSPPVDEKSLRSYASLVPGEESYAKHSGEYSDGAR